MTRSKSAWLASLRSPTGPRRRESDCQHHHKVTHSKSTKNVICSTWGWRAFGATFSRSRLWPRLWPRLSRSVAQCRGAPGSQRNWRHSPGSWERCGTWTRCIPRALSPLSPAAPFALAAFSAGLLPPSPEVALPRLQQLSFSVWNVDLGPAKGHTKGQYI